MRVGIWLLIIVHCWAPHHIDFTERFKAFSTGSQFRFVVKVGELLSRCIDEWQCNKVSALRRTHYVSKTRHLDGTGS